MQKIVPHLWFDKEARQAARFYAEVFGGDSEVKGDSEMHDTPSGDVDILSFTVLGYEFMAISAGPMFKLNPSVSFMVLCESKEEVDQYWQKLVDDGMALMPLNSYEFSEWYGWVQDKYGVNWQLILHDDALKVEQRIMPATMFIGDNYGKAQEAIDFYLSVFKNSGVEEISRYDEASDHGASGYIEHGRIKLEDQLFVIMENSYDHKFALNEAVSFMVFCEDQAEIDYYWEKLSAVPEAERCGWCKDQYGMSWQIIPKNMSELVSTAAGTQAMLKMGKLDIVELKKANGGA